jgi:saccharopine dehydrogenase-like NADP-dependent oxidoreductase
LRNDKKALLRILQEGTAYHKKDKVVMSVIGRTNLGTLEKTQTIHATDEFSAMQRATAFPISAVADLMARGMFDEHRYANYHHVPLSEFNENLNKLFG